MQLLKQNDVGLHRRSDDASSHDVSSNLGAIERHVRLGEVQGSPARQVLCSHQRKHAAIAAVVLHWGVLWEPAPPATN